MADKDPLPQAQLGAIHAMGAMPHWLLQDRWMPLMKLTVRWMQQSIDKRVQMVKCLSHWLRKVDLPLTEEWEAALWNGLEDYTIDERGDSGAMLREAIINLWHQRTDFRWRAELWRMAAERIDRIRQACLSLLKCCTLAEFNESDPLIRQRFCMGLVYAAGSPLPSQHASAIQLMQLHELSPCMEWWQQERLIDGLIRLGLPEHLDQMIHLTEHCDNNMNRLILVYTVLVEKHSDNIRVQQRLAQGHPYPRIQSIILSN